MDNQAAENAEWYEALLGLELGDLQGDGFELALTGFDDDELNRLLAGLGEDDDREGEDDLPEPPADPVSRPGDLWLLGPHRLLCGDATVITDLDRLMAGRKTELPRALKWQVLNAEEDYDAMSVEARRATSEALRVTSESFAIATVASDADRRCRRALMEEWVGRETASFRLPPSRLALDAGDVVRLDHDGRLSALRLTSTADAGARTVEAMRTDANAYGLAPGPERQSRAPKPVVYGPPTVAFLDLPQLRESVPAHQPLAAVYTVPWTGRVTAAFNVTAPSTERSTGHGASASIQSQRPPRIR